MSQLSKLRKCTYNILLLGAPGVGKGTYGKLLSAEMNANIMESGALCRAAAASDIQIRNIINSGNLLDANLIFKMVENYLHSNNNNSDDKMSILFDGYPRNIQQAQVFHDSALGMEYPFDLAIHFKLPHHILMAKLLGRRVCANKECNANYNVCDINEGDIVMKAMKPIKNECFCDKCGSELIKREDDKQEIIENRLNVFDAVNGPLIEFYENKGILMEYDIKKGVDDFPDILDKIEQKLLLKWCN